MCLQVGSRMVIVASGILMVAMGVFGKIGAIFTTIPTPVVGGMFMVMFGVISAAGVSNLQVNVNGLQCNAKTNPTRVYIDMRSFKVILKCDSSSVLSIQYTDMNSSRNIFVFGFSIFSGLVIPNWIMKNPNAIATGALASHAVSDTEALFCFCTLITGETLCSSVLL